MPFQIPLPPEMAVDSGADICDIEDASLALYQRVAELSRQADDSSRREKQALDEQAGEFRKLAAVLAAVRFEFERLSRRLVPELTRLEAAQLIRALDLFQRAWDQTLRRYRIEVIDPAGWPLTDELASDVDVEGHVPDQSATETTVRETMAPLVRLDGRTILLAKVITSVPAPQEELPQ